MFFTSLSPQSRDLHVGHRQKSDCLQEQKHQQNHNRYQHNFQNYWRRAEEPIDEPVQPGAHSTNHQKSYDSHLTSIGTHNAAQLVLNWRKGKNASLSTSRLF
jgi:hypothetical protein